MTIRSNDGSPSATRQDIARDIAWFAGPDAREGQWARESVSPGLVALVATKMGLEIIDNTLSLADTQAVKWAIREMTPLELAELEIEAGDIPQRQARAHLQAVLDARQETEGAGWARGEYAQVVPVSQPHHFN